MEIVSFFDTATWTFTYLVYDAKTRDAVIIDPVLDFDPLTVDVSTTSADEVIAKVEELDLKVHYIMDTHAHADHLSAFTHLKQKLGAKTAIGAQIDAVQDVFKGIFNFPDTFATDGSQWDVLIRDGETIKAGSLEIKPMHTPGHTPACYTFVMGDVAFIGDTLFMPDSGTGRCDFPGGSADAMYTSIQRIYALPDDTRLFVGHDYQPGGREVLCETTVAESKAKNTHMRADTTREEYVALRTARDATLKPPRLIFQSLQVNANGGELPAPESNGMVYLRMPMGVFSAAKGA